MLPIPPTTAAVNPFNPAMKPMKWKICVKTSPNITPAAPASAEPMKKVDAITRSASIPIIIAASRSYAVARIAFPSRERRTKTVRTIISRSAPAITKIRVAETNTVPSWTPPGLIRPNGYERNCEPSSSSALFWRKNDTPSALISGAIRGASRSGR
jgi:hypothetical protein